MAGLGVRLATAMFIIPVFSGCHSGSTPPPPQTSPTSPIKSSTETTSAGRPDETTAIHEEEGPKTTRRRTISPVEIVAPEQGAANVRTMSSAEQLDAIRAALKPFQVLLGQWNGISQKQVVDHPVWAYDWITNPKQPGLRIRSEKGVYVRDGILSYLPDADQFEFKATDAEGTIRTFRGTLIQPVNDVLLDEKKPQRTYKLQLAEPESNAAGEQWRITFNQQENNRYILELDRKRGNGPFGRVDTVHTQREGTSFALSDTDYGDKVCVISQGLGTISVSYNGQSYWVCCSGCKAAFEDDPEKWIAKWEEKKKAKGK